MLKNIFLSENYSIHINIIEIKSVSTSSEDIIQSLRVEVKIIN